MEYEQDENTQRNSSITHNAEWYNDIVNLHKMTLSEEENQPATVQSNEV